MSSMLSESFSSPELSVSVPRLSVLVRLGHPSSPVKLKLRSEASTSIPEDVSLPSSAADISSGLLDRLPLAKSLLPSVLGLLLDILNMVASLAVFIADRSLAHDPEKTGLKVR